MDLSICQSVTSAKTGCSDALPSGGEPRKFNFAFWSCATPVIDMVDKNKGTAKTVITINGEGFSQTECQNEILFSDNACTVITTNETSITCTLEKSYQPALGLHHPISMRVENRGNALVKIMSPKAQSFAIVPNIESISPVQGSLAGETRLTIKGFGYGGPLLVKVGFYPCNEVKSSYTEIICETPPSASSAEVDVSVFVMVNGAVQTVICETENEQCTYTYSSSRTLTISAIDTPMMSGTTTFTVGGTNFGNDTSLLELYIGTVPATILLTNDTTLIAMIENIPAGMNAVVVRHIIYGKAAGSLTVTGAHVIYSVLPSSGSIYGDTEIKISGNGFVDGHTTVTIGDNPCSINNISLSEVICTTSAGSAGITDVLVTSNNITYTAVQFDYAVGSTPFVSFVSPTSGLPGETLTVVGTNLTGKSVTVFMGNAPCSIISSLSLEIKCIIGAHATGLVPVFISVSDFGASNADVYFEYSLQFSKISPNKGENHSSIYLNFNWVLF